MVLRIAWVVAVLVVATTAAASPKRRVTVLDFDGPRKLADQAQRIVVTVLGDRYDIVSPKRWEAARSSTGGPRQWATAAKTAGIDNVIEGWVDPKGTRMHSMNVVVRSAPNGREIDSVSVKISETGVISDDRIRRFAQELEDILDSDDTQAAFDEIPSVPPGPTAALAATTVNSHPTDEPVIEVLLTGGFVSHHEGAVVWADGTVQFSGEQCTRRGKLEPARVATLIDALDRGGFFKPRPSEQRACCDAFDVEVAVRNKGRRATTDATLCGNETVTSQAYDLVWTVLGPNPCASP